MEQKTAYRKPWMLKASIYLGITAAAGTTLGGSFQAWSAFDSIKKNKTELKTVEQVTKTVFDDLTNQIKHINLRLDELESLNELESLKKDVDVNLNTWNISKPVKLPVKLPVNLELSPKTWEDYKNAVQQVQNVE
jgi:hypothetical protein